MHRIELPNMTLSFSHNLTFHGIIAFNIDGFGARETSAWISSYQIHDKTKTADDLRDFLHDRRRNGLIDNQKEVEIG